MPKDLWDEAPKEAEAMGRPDEAIALDVIKGMRLAKRELESRPKKKKA